MHRTPLVAGNWKMNGRRAMAASLAAEIAAAAPAGVEVVLCPPLVYLDTVAGALRGSAVVLAAQNLDEHEDGAFTGEVSAAMLADVGCGYVLVGHSERRTLFAESNARVADKFFRALSAGLRPVFCVGETLAEREAGNTARVIDAQLDAVFSRATTSQMAGVVIAYEPVWAIGTGVTASPEQAQDVHAHIRTRLQAVFGAPLAQSLRLLYGGSVKADNAASLFAGADIDGGLVGGASLDAATFLAICQAATA
jgi:triosephosphate isomerase (TIM)